MDQDIALVYFLNLAHPMCVCATHRHACRQRREATVHGGSLPRRVSIHEPWTARTERWSLQPYAPSLFVVYSWSASLFNRRMTRIAHRPIMDYGVEHGVIVGCKRQPSLCLSSG